MLKYKIIFVVFMCLFALLSFNCSNDYKLAANDSDAFIKITKLDPQSVTIGGTTNITVKCLLMNSGDKDVSIEVRGDYNSTCLAFIKNDFGSIHSDEEKTFTLNTASFNAGCNQGAHAYTIIVSVMDGNTSRHSNQMILGTTQGGGGGGGGGEDPKIKLINKAREMATGSPRFFEIPHYSNNLALNNLNSSGSIGWRPARDGVELSTYRSKLTQALTSNPTDWYGYNCPNGSTNSGFPYPDWDPAHPEIFEHYDWLHCASGYSCFTFVCEACRLAGINLPYIPPDNAGQFIEHYTTITANNRKIGDLVLYNFDRSGGINPSASDFSDHVAIITQVNNSNLKNDIVISAFGYHEIFGFGVKEIKLWDFHSNRDPHPTGTKGLFIPNAPYGNGFWQTDPTTGWDNWNESNIKFVRIIN